MLGGGAVFGVVLVVLVGAVLLAALAAWLRLRALGQTRSSFAADLKDWTVTLGGACSRAAKRGCLTLGLASCWPSPRPSGRPYAYQGLDGLGEGGKHSGDDSGFAPYHEFVDADADSGVHSRSDSGDSGWPHRHGQGREQRNALYTPAPHGPAAATAREYSHLNFAPAPPASHPTTAAAPPAAGARPGAGAERDYDRLQLGTRASGEFTHLDHTGRVVEPTPAAAAEAAADVGAVGDDIVSGTAAAVASPPLSPTTRAEYSILRAPREGEDTPPEVTDEGSPSSGGESDESFAIVDSVQP